MANNTLGGFRFAKMRNGGERAPVETFPVADNYGTSLFRGDPVKRVSDGTIAIAAAGDTNILGIFDGVVQYKNADGVMRPGNYLPSGTRHDGVGSPTCSMARVILAKDAVFEVDGNDGTTFVTLATAMGAVGENADHVSGTGVTASGRSAYALNISDHKTTTANWRIVGVNTSPDNDATASRFKYLVVLNESDEPTTGSTSGI